MVKNSALAPTATVTVSTTVTSTTPPIQPCSKPIKPATPTFVSNYRLHVHIVCFLLSLSCYINNIQLAIACIQDLPDMRLIFAMIFRSQENNQAVNYGWISSVLVLLTLYPHIYLVSEYYFLTWDHILYHRRRSLIRHLYIFMSTMTILLPSGVIYQLSRMTPLENIKTTMPYSILYTIVCRFATVFGISVLAFFALPITAPMYQPQRKVDGDTDAVGDEVHSQQQVHSTTNTTNTTNTTTPSTTTNTNRSSTLSRKQRLLQEQRQKIAPLNPNDHISVFKELHERFPDHGDEDMVFGNRSTLEIIKNAQISSRFEPVSSSESADDDDDDDDSATDNDTDYNDVGDNDDVGVVTDKLDQMISEMTAILGKATRDENEKKKRKQD